MLNDNKSETVDESQVNFKIVTILTLYCASGSLLTLLNKLAIVIFPFMNMLLVLQNGVTVLLLLAYYYLGAFSFESVPPLHWSLIQIWSPVVLLFVAMLMSSLFALVYVSVSTVIVIRNLSTLVVALLEYAFLGNQQNLLSVGTLIGMLLGAIVYAAHDLTFSIPGYIWLLVNIVSTSVYQVYIKKIVNIPSIKEVGPIGMSFYNNLLSLPIFILVGLCMGESKSLWTFAQTISSFNVKSTIIIFLTCILGFSLSTSAFALNKLISATSIMVANNVNKFLLIALSELFIQSTLNSISSIAAAFVLLFGWLYSQSKEKFAKVLFTVATFLFIVLYAILELRLNITPILHPSISSKLWSMQQVNRSISDLVVSHVNLSSRAFAKNPSH